MNDEQIKKIIEDGYDANREEGILSMARDFYSRRMRSTAIMVWFWAIAFFALAAYGTIQFFRTDQTQTQILGAALFIVGCLGIGMMKIFAWEMVHRHSIKRDIKRLELRVAELSELLQNRS